MKFNNKIINIEKTADILGVSTTTIRNWIRHKYLTPIGNNKNILFLIHDVNILKNKIESGEIERLDKRANKRNSNKIFLPREYLENNYSVTQLVKITNFILAHSIKIDHSIFLLALNLFLKENFIYTHDVEKLLKFKINDYKNLFVLNIFKEFFDKLDNFSFKKTYSEILKFEIPQQTDVLGLIYQSLKSEGDKARGGSYYTPKNIVDEIVNEYVQPNHKILDPCCGTGQFLLCASKKVNNPLNIYGFDIDPIAVFISKLNLIFKYRSLDFNPNIFLRNSLLDTSSPSDFDLIITNPPWGLHFEENQLDILKKDYPQIKSFESFSYSLIKSIELLKENGILSFILPESILNIKVHRDIRNYILNSSIIKIVKLGNCFTNVFTNTFRIDIKKQKPINHKINIISTSSYSIRQDRFITNPDFIFDIEIDDFTQRTIEKVFNRPHITLENNADWALGIVTGDNKKYITSTKQDGYEAIFKGKDIKKYFIPPAESYIKFEPKIFQQVAPVEKYRAKEKLIYKFISSKLTFAYDDKGRLTLNSANILIPKIEGYPIKIILALFNSSLYQFIYKKKFNTIKVLRGNLEQLPLPILTDSEKKKIIALVDKVLRKDVGYEVVDDFVMKLFRIAEKERRSILKIV